MKRKIIFTLLIIALFLTIASSGLVYWKIKRIAKSITESAKRANSQNTPLVDE